MLANRLVFNALLKKNLPVNALQGANCITTAPSDSHDPTLAIGKREWVCYGINSMPHYADRADFPMPAIRFKEIAGDLIALREKEKGSWKNLTLDEKKQLYRASFCQTLCEANAPTGQWKGITGWSLFLVSIALWCFILEKMFIYKAKPISFSEEWRAASLRRQIEFKMNHLTGVSGNWDYEKDDWKK